MPGIEEKSDNENPRNAGANINDENLEKKVIEIILQLSNRFRALEKASVKKCFRVGNSTVIITEKDKSALLIGRGGRIVREISRALGTIVKVVEEGDELEIAKELLSPINVRAMKIVYAPDKSEEYVVVLSRKDREKLKNEKRTKIIFKEITGKDMNIVFE